MSTQSRQLTTGHQWLLGHWMLTNDRAGPAVVSTSGECCPLSHHSPMDVLEAVDAVKWDVLEAVVALRWNVLEAVDAVRWNVLQAVDALSVQSWGVTDRTTAPSSERLTREFCSHNPSWNLLTIFKSALKGTWSTDKGYSTQIHLCFTESPSLKQSQLSHHPLTHKRSVVRTLTNRAQQYVTTAEDRKSELAHVHNALRANGYPEWALAPPPPSAKRPPNTNNNPRRPMLGLPYMAGLSEQLGRIYKSHKIHMYHKSVNTLRSMVVHPKDKTPKEHKCGTIYNINSSM
ncbi:hypothetical protein NP493_248g01019 [Ridgeia piscesae]|uniref:Helix-turn-helix domain-containing protein n=1 Tax=Ridgeia piscesae TaxID=27915 RepID=A0AAD9NYV9_RIDPI|nr:hypothetical protein NP493_248g01019 [Ridgeia piscesae]